jgi:hypothetical protein
MFRNPEYSEEAISRIRTYLSLASLDDPFRPVLSGILASPPDERVREFGVGGVQEGCSNDPGFVHLSSLSSLTASLTGSNSSMIDEQRDQHFEALRSIAVITDIAEIEVAIKYCRLLVASVHRHPIHRFAYIPVHEVGGLLFRVFDQLRAVNPALAEKFVAINRKLEKVTMSMEIDDSEVEGPEGMDPFGRLVVKQQKLSEERDKLISQIRALSDFSNFLMPPLFDTLRSAALRGPVIIINHCKWRPDILVLFNDSPPSLIITTDYFYDRAIKLSDRLVKTRKDHCLESKQYQRSPFRTRESL